MYHDVVAQGACDASGFPGEGAAVYKLEEEEFRKHLAAIREVIRDGPVDTIGSFNEWDRRPLLLTFDDGGVSGHSLVSGWLEEYGWRAHFFITTDWIDKRGFMSRSQIRELRKQGHVIGSHSRSHPERMSSLSRAELLEEWSTSVRVLSEILGEPVTTASVPGGYYSRKVAGAAASAGVQTLFTSEPTMKGTWVGGCLVLGRYALLRGMNPEVSAALAAGWLGPRLKQACWWNLKKCAKYAGGEFYPQLRRRLLARRSRAGCPLRMEHSSR